MARNGSTPRAEKQRAIQQALLMAAVGLLVFLLFGVLPMSPDFGHRTRTARSSDAVCEKLQNWVWKVGGRIEGVLCVNRPMQGGRGLVASRQLYSNEPIFDLPKEATITAATVKKHTPKLFNLLNDDQRLAEECGKKWGSHNMPCRLALAVVYLSSGVDSFWGSAYFDTIPTKPTSAVWWNDTQLATFESPVVAKRFQGYRTWHQEHFDSVGKYMIETYPDMFGTMTFERLLWATLLIETRAFSCPSAPMDKPSTTWCLVPYIDLVNHQSYVGSEYGIDSYVKGWYQCLSSEAYEAGAEIFISYGSHHHTSHFLETYGFAPGGFEHMDVVGFHFPPNDLSARKCRGGKVSEYCPGDLVAVAGIDGCLRTNKGESFERKVASLLTGNQVQRISPSEIANARKFIRDSINREIASFSTTYESDAGRLVSGESLTFDEYAVLAVRSRYKRVLHAVATELTKSEGSCSEKRFLYARDIADRSGRNPGSSTDSWLYKLTLVKP